LIREREEDLVYPHPGRYGRCTMVLHMDHPASLGASRYRLYSGSDVSTDSGVM